MNHSKSSIVELVSEEPCMFTEEDLEDMARIMGLYAPMHEMHCAKCLKLFVISLNSKKFHCPHCESSNKSTEK